MPAPTLRNHWKANKEYDVVNLTWRRIATRQFRYAMNLVIQISNAAPVVDTEALRRELEARIEGEVRFDAVSRALYSTDASVYQIHPVGVVVPWNRDDILRTLEICRRFACPLTMP